MFITPLKTISARLFGGRNVSVIYDQDAATITIVGQSISLTTLSSALQAEWSDAIALCRLDANGNSMGGGNMQQAIGDILNASPVWSAAIQAVLSTIPQQH